MSEDRNRLASQNDESENEDVEAHRLASATEDPDASDDNDVEAHKLA